MKNVMKTYWPVRKLLIGKLFLLNADKKDEPHTPKDFFFGIQYPDPTFLMSEDFRVFKCLMQLENEGWIKLKNIKIQPDYVDFYSSNEVSKSNPELIGVAKKENYGLPKTVLNKVKQSKNITKEELTLILQSKETEFTDEWGDGPLICIYGNHHLIFPFFISHYLSFNIEKNITKIRNDITKYINDFIKGQLAINNLLYFGYDFQKKLFLEVLSKIFQKQGKQPIIWNLGYWHWDKKPTIYEEKDELLSLLKKEYPEHYNSWVIKEPISDHQYEFRPYETLLALEREEMVEIKNIKSQRATIISPEHGSYLLQDESQIITTIILNVQRSYLANDKNEKASGISEETLKTKQMLDKLESLLPSSKRETKEIILYLNQNGDLYREPKKGHCYPMGEKSDRHKIVRYLAKNKRYEQTKEISNYLEGKSEQSIRTEIRKMRNNAKKFLKIKNDIIEGKKESGYRINPKYKIHLKSK